MPHAPNCLGAFNNHLDLVEYVTADSAIISAIEHGQGKILVPDEGASTQQTNQYNKVMFLDTGNNS